MKKSISFLIIPTMLISSCALTSRCSALWDKIFHRNKQQDVITIDSIVSGLEKLETLDSFTVKTDVTFTGTDSKNISGEYVPTSSSIDMHYTVEQVGKNSRTLMSYASTETTKISEVKKVLKVSDEEVMNALLEAKYNSLESEWSDSDVLIDKSKDEVKFVSTTKEEETFVLYDEEAHQTFDYSIDDDEDDIEYNVEEGGMGLIDTKDIIEAVKKGTINGDTVTATIDGTEVVIKVSLSNGYISKLEADVNETTHLAIEYSKFNETSFEIPAGAHKPVCKWKHDGQTPFHYHKTEAGHKRYCANCYKFLDESETEHVHAHNGDKVCELCGYLAGTDDADTKTVPGFERGEKGYFLEAKAVGQVYANVSVYYNDKFSVEESDSSGATIRYYVFLEDNVIVVGKQSSTKLTDCCLNKKEYVFDIYRNLSSDTMATIYETYQSEGYNHNSSLAAIKTYLSSLTKNATTSGRLYEISHTYHFEDPVVIDECHKYTSSRCSECGALLSANIQTSHTGTLLEQETVIDACHKLIKKDCPVCHEHTEEIKTEHAASEPRLEETVIDPCHKLIKGYCSTCGDYLGKMVQANHTGSTKLVNIQVDSCTTRILTVCTSCECIVNEESISNHEHVTEVTCGYADLADYGLSEKLSTSDSVSTFVFNYCEDCHKVSDGLVKEYGSGMSMDHPYYESYYTLHNISGSYDQTSSQYGQFDHSLDEHGICIYCHSKVVTMGDESIGFIARYNTQYEYWYDYYFYNKTTGSHIWISEFDYSPEEGTDDIGGYYEYTNDSYPGVAVRVYAGENGYDAIKVFYNNLSESVVIRKTDFAH